MYACRPVSLKTRLASLKKSYISWEPGSLEICSGNENKNVRVSGYLEGGCSLGEDLYSLCTMACLLMFPKSIGIGLAKIVDCLVSCDATLI